MDQPTAPLSRAPALKAQDAAVLVQLISFIAVGGVAALSYTLLTSALIELLSGISSVVIGTVCYALFIGPVYLAHRQLAFRSGVPHTVALPRYIAVQCCALVLAALFSQLAYGALGLASLPGAFLVIAGTSAVNFVVLKVWAFAAPR